MKKVIVDARMIFAEGHGIGNYVEDLLEGLRAIQQNNYRISVLVNPDTPRRMQGYERIECDIPFLHWRELFGLGPALHGADLYHSMSFSSAFRLPCPHLVTIHDLNHLHYGSTQKKLYYRFALRRFALSARKVSTVSEASRQELQQWLNIGSIAVVPNPICLPDLQGSPKGSVVKRASIKPGQYFCSLATVKQHKNLELLLRAYAAYRDAAGKGAWPLVLLEAIDQPGVVSLQKLSESEKFTLMKNAGAVIAPSLFEGFGRVPVEAAMLGTRVIASDIAPHREGLRGVESVHFFDASNQGACQQALHAAQAQRIDAPTQAEQNVLKGRYDSVSIAQLMHQVYREVLQ